MDILKMKRLFNLKSMTYVLAVVLVFNMGRLYSGQFCTSSSSLSEARPGRSLQDQGQIVIPRQVKAHVVSQQFDLSNVEVMVAQTAHTKEEEEEGEKKGRLPDRGKLIVDVTKKPQLVKELVKVPNDELFDKKGKSAGNVNSRIKNNNVNKMSKVTNRPKLGQQSHSHGKTAKPGQATDYYGTGTAAHLAGLKKMGLSSVSQHTFKSPYIVEPHVYSNDTIRKAPGYRKKKLIACYNCPHRFYLMAHFNKDFEQCPYSECEFSQTPAFDEKADMMIFWQDPGTDPPKRPLGQLWTYMSWESPINRAYPRPAEKWRDVFNHTITFLREADFPLPYESMVWRDPARLQPDDYYVRAAKWKTRTAAWWVSHCKTPSKRMDYILEMKKYIPDIDIYGACGDLVCDTSHSGDCWGQLNSTYRFYMGFENSFCPEYVTEKFFKVFRYRYPVIPVVRGGVDYDKYFPKDTFINAAKFASAKDLAHYLIRLGKDHVRLGKMYKEKDRVGILNRKMDWCDFCEKVHTGGFKKQVIHDVKEYSFSKPCWNAPNDIK